MRIARTPSRAAIVLWLACVSLLWASYNWNVFGIPLIKIDAYSEGLVVRRITAAHAGDPVPGGFLILPPERVRWVGITMYTSSPGWQGRMLSAAHALTGGAVAQFAGRAKAVFALLTAAVAAGFVVLMLRHFGSIAAAFALIAFLFSPPIVTLARDLYWSIFIPMGCALAAWHLFGRIQHSRVRPHVVYALIGALTSIKSLTGYEWITTVTLNACVPIAYFAYLSRWKASHLLRHAAWAIAYCVAGFALALGVHVTQGFAAFGNWHDAWSPIISRASANTYGNPFYGARFNYENPQYYPSVPMIRVVYGYLTQTVLTLPGGVASITVLTTLGAALGALAAAAFPRRVTHTPPLHDAAADRPSMALRVAAALAAVVAVAVWLLGPARDSTIPDHLTGKALYRLPGPMLAFALSIAFVHVSRVRRAATVADDVRQRTDRNNTALIIAMSGALIAAFSWVVLAKHHSAYHTTVNALLFSMLFVPLLAAWLGHTLSATIITQRALAGARSEVDGS